MPAGYEKLGGGLKPVIYLLINFSFNVALANH